MSVPQIPRNLPVFSSFICISSRANLGTQGFPVALHCTHLRLLWESKGRGSWQAQGSQQLPWLLLAWNGTGPLSLQQLPLPEPLALTGTKVMPGVFPACLQPLQHHQTSLWVLQEVQRQQQTWLSSRTPLQLYFPVFITASLLHQQLGYIVF